MDGAAAKVAIDSQIVADGVADGDASSSENELDVDDANDVRRQMRMQLEKIDAEAEQFYASRSPAAAIRSFC